jgi:hypothetical protein
VSRLLAMQAEPEDQSCEMDWSEIAATAECYHVDHYHVSIKVL